jgi:long-chain acyl-CoA synthetase
MQTLVELLAQSADRFGDAPAVSLYGREPWTWSYRELWDQSRRAATYLRNAGVQKGDRIVMWGPNRPEWVAAFFGAMIAGAIVVPLDVRSREDLLVRLEEQTEPVHLFLGEEQEKALTAAHPPITRIEDLQDKLAGLPPAEVALGAIAPSDTVELVFTSGTTGNPKGVILTHGNIVANVLAGKTAFPPTLKNHVLSLLPLSHMFEQTTGLFIPLTGGSSVTYISSLRPDVIFNAMQWSHTTNMGCVPQVLALFRDGILREVRKQGKEATFNRLHRIAARLPMGLRRLLFRPVHARMGGHFQYFVSGGARLDPGLARWWEEMGFKVCQGYGMTEAAPVVACHTEARRDPESVGRPLPGVEVRLAQDGEILVRGANVSPGYWRHPELTAEAFDNGWYKTGDLGAWDSKGNLTLRGRKKNMIVLANGLNVYPEDVENILLTDPRVKNVVVLGVPEGDDVEVHAVLLGVPPEQAAAVVKATNAQLAPHQRIGGFTVWPDEEFPMTPTLKVKRAEVADRLPELRTKQSAAAR